MIDYRAFLRALSDAGVRFTIVGGAAATAHGAARLTQDLDIVYRRDAEICGGSPVRSLRTSPTRAAHRGRPKDLEAIAELEALVDRKER